MGWLIVGLLGWAMILTLAMAMARAAAKPWPERVERFRKGGDDDHDDES